ncbi:MAG: hypothetical protein RLP44_12895 [Aggregatilineales bacterium]
MRRMIVCLFMLILLAGSLAGCNRGTGQDVSDLPTRVTSLDALATSQVLTQNAPPEGFRETVAYPQVDANLASLPNWHYTMTLQFEGVYAGTPREAVASTRLDVWFNQLDTARRVVLNASGILLGSEAEAPIQREGVRLGPDVYYVIDSVCQGEGSPDAELLANLRAGEIIGGLTHASSTSERATINGEQVWRYEFAPEDFNIPALAFSENSQITNLSGEFWVAPVHGAVVRFWVTMDVENVVITFLSDDPDSALPVSGQVVLRYDLFEIGVNPNITQPFGC